LTKDIFYSVPKVEELVILLWQIEENYQAMEPMENQREMAGQVNQELITTPDMTNNQKCQYQAPNCSQKAQFQHILKLGSVKVGKQWVCANCKQALESKAQ